MLKKFVNLLLISMLLSGCATFAGDDLKCEYSEQQIWRSDKQSESNLVTVIKIEPVSCQRNFYSKTEKKIDRGYSLKRLSLNLTVYNRTQTPVQTNIFADRLQLVAKNNAVYALDLTKNTNNAGEIINPNGMGGYHLSIEDSQIFDLFALNQIAFINFHLGFSSKTIILLRSPDETKAF